MSSLMIKKWKHCKLKCFKQLHLNLAPKQPAMSFVDLHCLKGCLLKPFLAQPRPLRWQYCSWESSNHLQGKLRNNHPEMPPEICNRRSDSGAIFQTEFPFGGSSVSLLLASRFCPATQLAHGTFWMHWCKAPLVCHTLDMLRKWKKMRKHKFSHKT